MFKQDLKDGMILETRNSDRYLFINGNILGLDGFVRFSNYSEDLKNKLTKDFDVVKVYKTDSGTSLEHMLDDECLTLLWERKEIELSHREIEMLKAFKTLGYTYIARDKDGGLYTYNSKIRKGRDSWFNDGNFIHIDIELFNFIKWLDEEPINIDDLLKENN